MSAPTICVPGQRLCREESKLSPGRGTYTRNGFIYASLAGKLETSKKTDNKTILEVVRETEQNIVPAVDALVTARVTNVNPRFCKCNIIKIGHSFLTEPFKGQIRREDVRATEKDKVEMYKCFKPGDIIIARVISLGDTQSYLLTTAENELGVVVATSESGKSMVPVSWCKMRCPKTLLDEERKVAKAQPSFIEYSEKT